MWWWDAVAHPYTATASMTFRYCACARNCFSALPACAKVAGFEGGRRGRAMACLSGDRPTSVAQGAPVAVEKIRRALAKNSDSDLGASLRNTKTFCDVRAEMGRGAQASTRQSTRATAITAAVAPRWRRTPERYFQRRGQPGGWGAATSARTEVGQRK